MTKQNFDNSDSWGQVVNPGLSLYHLNMKMKNNNTYIVGYYSQRILLTKFNRSGINLWKNIWNTPHPDDLKGFEVDSDENLYILSVTDPQYPSEDLEEIYLIKYSPSGELLWAKVVNKSRGCDAYSLKIDLNNFIYITGEVWNSTSNFKFLLKLNSSGNLIWRQKLEVEAQNLEIDFNNNIFFSGYFNGKFTLYKYNSSGSNVWFQFSEAAIDSINFDSSENIILTGSGSNINWSEIIYFLKFNSSGDYINKLEFPSSYYRWSHYHCQNWFIRDNCYLFIDDPYSDNAYLLKYNSTFQLQWNITLKNYYETPYYDLIHIAIDMDSLDNILFLYNKPQGDYVHFKKYQSEDISILKINSSGDILSHYLWGGPYHEEPIQILIDPQNNLYLLCVTTYVDIWNHYGELVVLIKNPENNGVPPHFVFPLTRDDYYLFSFMGVMSVISITLLFSIMIPKLKRILQKRKPKRQKS